MESEIKWPSARQQVAGTGVDANPREVVNEEDVLRPQFELHGVPSRVSQLTPQQGQVTVGNEIGFSVKSLNREART
jgi:hypothetical protein